MVTDENPEGFFVTRSRYLNLFGWANERWDFDILNQAAYNAAINARLPLNTRQDTFDALSGPVGAAGVYSTSGSGVNATYSVASNIPFNINAAGTPTPTPSLGIVDDGFGPDLSEDLTISLGPLGRGIALQVLSSSALSGLQDFWSMPSEQIIIGSYQPAVNSQRCNRNAHWRWLHFVLLRLCSG